MTDTITITDLTKIATEHRVSPSSATELQAAFMPYFKHAHDLAEIAKSIKVTNIGQTAEMGRAKEQFRAIQKVLSETEKTRVDYKAESLQRGRAVDGMAHIIKHILEPAKAYLEDQWKYGERLREAAQAEARDLRMCEAGKYLEFFPQTIDLGVIADEEYAKLLHYATAQWNAREAAAKQIENERIERERREAAEREALRVENEKLRAEAVTLAIQQAKEREAAANIRAEQEARLAVERANVERLQRAAEAKEQAEKQRIAEENRREMERADAARERARKEQAEKEAVEKAANEAPDKEKLVSYAKVLWDIPQPQFATEQAAEKFGRAAQKIAEAIKILQS